MRGERERCYWGCGWHGRNHHSSCRSIVRKSSRWSCNRKQSSVSWATGGVGGLGGAKDGRVAT
jgi:hypothetical protein